MIGYLVEEEKSSTNDYIIEEPDKTLEELRKITFKKSKIKD